MAAHWMGWQNVWHSEIDDFCNRVTKKHFPESQQYGDIKQTDWTKAEAVDLITGGFPCQPFSTAGKQGGTEDDRYLWPEMYRSIKQVNPRWIVAENVYGLVSWNEGLVLDTVLSDLENEGYEIQTHVLPASGVNAPHRRYRVWIVAYSKSNGNSGKKSKHRRQKNKKEWAGVGSEFINNGRKRTSPNTKFEGLERGIRMGESIRSEQRSKEATSHSKSFNERDARLCKERTQVETRGCDSGEAWFSRFPSTPPICGGNDGLPDRVHRIKALGNAIVPQVAFQIFKAIEQYETQMELI